jgi:hypothetical protein
MFPGVRLRSPGYQTITLADTVYPFVGGAAAVTINVGPINHFEVTAPASGTAGSSFNVVLTAFDAGDNRVIAYADSVHFTSDDGNATLPADYTFVAGDQGMHTFPGLILTRAGADTITVTDKNAAVAGSVSVNVASAAASRLLLSAPPTASANFPISIVVTAQDLYGNRAGSYAGTVQFTSSDGQASLPPNYAFQAGDNGSHTVSGFTLKTPGSQTVTAADTVASSITGSAMIPVVSDPPLTAMSRTLRVPLGRPFFLVVATFTDADPTPGPSANFSATIDWGDGTSSPGVVTGPDGGPFLVSGSHQYNNLAALAKDIVTVTIRDNGGAVAVVTTNLRFWPRPFSN